jgi:endoglucanase Acf2
MCDSMTHTTSTSLTLPAPPLLPVPSSPFSASTSLPFRTPQAVNAYYAVYLYALATANVDLTHFSHLLLSMEVQSAQLYWHMPNDDIYDSVFSASRMAGNIGALDVTASTWFGNELEYVHGINL